MTGETRDGCYLLFVRKGMKNSKVGTDSSAKADFLMEKNAQRRHPVFSEETAFPMLLFHLHSCHLSCFSFRFAFNFGAWEKIFDKNIFPLNGGFMVIYHGIESAVVFFVIFFTFPILHLDYEKIISLL